MAGGKASSRGLDRPARPELRHSVSFSQVSRSDRTLQRLAWRSLLPLRQPCVAGFMSRSATSLVPPLYGCCNPTKSKGPFPSSKFVDVGLPATSARSKRLLAHLPQPPGERVLQCALDRVPWASHGDATALTGALVVRTRHTSLMRGAARFETPRRGRKGRKRPRIQRPADPKKACCSSRSLASWAGGARTRPKECSACQIERPAIGACSTYAPRSSRHDRHENTEGSMSWRARSRS